MWTKSNDKNEQKKALQDPAGGLAKAGVWHICAKSCLKLQSNLLFISQAVEIPKGQKIGGFFKSYFGINC